jgi:hypothetical protein
MIGSNNKFCIFFLMGFISCAVVSQEKPAEMFAELFEKYKNTEYDTRQTHERISLHIPTKTYHCQ